MLKMCYKGVIRTDISIKKPFILLNGHGSDKGCQGMIRVLFFQVKVQQACYFCGDLSQPASFGAHTGIYFYEVNTW